MLIVGEKEAAEGRLSVRKHGEGDLGSHTVDGFIQYCQGIIAESLSK